MSGKPCPRENPVETTDSVDLLYPEKTTEQGFFPRPAVAEAKATLGPDVSSGSSRLTEGEGVIGKPREATSEVCGSSPSEEVPRVQ